MLAYCAIPISALIKSRPFIRLVNHPMTSVASGEIVAHINVDIRSVIFIEISSLVVLI